MPYKVNIPCAEVDDAVFDRRESDVRSYALSFPTSFVRAQGDFLYDDQGHGYIDFLAGCSSLNYGHNPSKLKFALMDYIARDGVTHSLDMQTDAKADFLEDFETLILKPRGMDHLVQFTGPTGTNAVEAALKIARKKTGRTNVIAFTNGFHGCSLGALAATGNQHHRGGAGHSLTNVTHAPFDRYHGDDVDTAEQLDQLLSDPSSGMDPPAAIMLETVQGEGGLNAASFEWLRKIEKIARAHGALLIVDDIQAGVGRTGSFFSFESAGIKPDIITLAKSLSGYGLPFAVTLMRPELDLWEPGEHNGTFRGNCHAFVTASAALRAYWADSKFEKEIETKSEKLRSGLERLARKVGDAEVQVKGRGMMLGLDVGAGDIAQAIVEGCFDRKLIIETSGARDEVVKCLMPLTISDETLSEGLDILSDVATSIFAERDKKAA